ncbi:MAG TPA: alternative ribosome rescue aminoacyl-tRNA hydrolase ArfB [Ilumatobacteraceae bacterium]|nr:alternative ribosome rescue aminoacyl-tRNA hydrolase ArfB [Ilumatobacteraceae bacterium]
MTTPLPPIAPDALSWRFTRAGGPGGQHVNTSSTRVELECDLSLAGFSATLTERLVNKLGPVVRVVVADTRSQRRNREIAEERLREMLSAASVVPRKRRPTKPGKAAVERRLDDKRRRSDRKAGRTWKPDD